MMVIVVVVLFLFWSAAAHWLLQLRLLTRALRCNVPGYRGPGGAYHCGPLPPGQLMVVGMTLFTGS